MKAYRILITGSRDWVGEQVVWRALADVVRELPVDREVVLVSGACPTGADKIAENWARKYGATIEAHPANWVKHGPKAGPIRNALMVTAGADICLAFVRNQSRGASHTARLAEEAGIPTRRYTA